MAIGAGGSFVAGSIIGKMMLDLSGWNQSIQKVKKDQASALQQTREYGAQMTSVGKMAVKAGLVIVGAMGGALKSYSYFNKSMT